MEPSLAPRALDALYALGHMMVDAARWQDSAKIFRVMLRLSPEDERPWLGLGHCHEQLGEEEIAAEIYGAGAAVLGERSPRCLLALARVKRRLGDMVAFDDCISMCAAIVDAGGHDDVGAMIRIEVAA